MTGHTSNLKVFVGSLRWEDAGEYPITAVIWLFLMVLLPIESHWVELAVIAFGGILMASTLEYKGKVQKRDRQLGI